VAEVDGGPHDHRVAVAGRHLADEGAVDLELVHRQGLQVRHRGVAGAEVVDRQAHPEGVQAAEHVEGERRVGHDGALGDLEHQPARRDLPMGQAAGDLLGEGGVQQGAGGDVHRDRQVMTGAVPLGGLAQRGIQDPAGERVVQRRPQLLGHADGALGRGVRQQHGELVAAQPGDGVDPPQHARHPAGDLGEQPVAVVVAEGVVDVLEPVEVQQQQGGGTQLPVGGPERLPDAVGEQLPVGQAGQRVVQRLVVAGGGLAHELPLVAERQQQEAAQREHAHQARDQRRRQQRVLAVAQQGHAGGRLGLFAVGERGGLVLEVDVGRVHPVRVEVVGRVGVAGVDQVEHLAHEDEVGGVPGLDPPGLGDVLGLAVDHQVAQGDAQRRPRLLQRRPQLGVWPGQVGVADGVLLATW
jgi:hypothetical protein